MPQKPTTGSEELEYEIQQAKAETLGRLGRRLEEALETLRGAEEEHSLYDRLLAEAGEALLFYVVQREVMGLRGTEGVLDELGVPARVRRRMNLNPYRGST